MWSQSSTTTTTTTPSPPVLTTVDDVIASVLMARPLSGSDGGVTPVFSTDASQEESMEAVDLVTTSAGGVKPPRKLSDDGNASTKSEGIPLPIPFDNSAITGIQTTTPVLDEGRKSPATSRVDAAVLIKTSASDVSLDTLVSPAYMSIQGASAITGQTTITQSTSDCKHSERKRRYSPEISHDSSVDKGPGDDTRIDDVRDYSARYNDVRYNNARSGDVKTDGLPPLDDNRDDEDDNDDDDDDYKLPLNNVDPERLKAFNLFVRLFIDENLDRSVPISKQPKEKIQAILEACDRQFSEFHDRARKRVRTYLKSCRRMRRSKDGNGIDQIVRPTPPHLTSAVAESILAQACENESNNAKRMRIGLEPLPNSGMSPIYTSLPTGLNQSGGLNLCASAQQQQQHQRPTLFPKQERVSPSRPSSQTSRDSRPFPEEPAPVMGSIFPFRHHASPVKSYVQGGCTSVHSSRPPSVSEAVVTSMCGGGTPGRAHVSILTGAAPSTVQRPAHHYGMKHLDTQVGVALLTQAAVNNNNTIQNDPTDLSVKKSTSAGTGNDHPAPHSVSRNQLNATEIATVKQLIISYRESAAFLYRSAEELEQLLLHQN